MDFGVESFILASYPHQAENVLFAQYLSRSRTTQGALKSEVVVGREVPCPTLKTAPSTMPILM